SLSRRTRSTISATAWLTSVETSRLAASSPPSGSRNPHAPAQATRPWRVEAGRSGIRGPGLFARGGRFGAVGAGGPKIRKASLDAFDVQTDRGIAREGQRDIAARVFARLEADREQRQHPIRSRGLQRLDLGAEHAIEAQRRAPSFILVVVCHLRRLLPIEAAE